jgi:RNA polymerase sigma-70 factor (ECF subfamily)
MPRGNGDWLVAVRAQEPQALEELRAVLRAGLRRGLSRQSVSEAQLDDFAQDALLEVMASVDRFRGASAFSTWALSIALRTAFDELRKARWKDVSLEQVLERPDPPPHDDALTRARALELLRDAIATELTAHQRETLVAVLKLEEAGMPIGEIAARLHTNRNALYKLTHDARLRLKAALIARGITAADVGWE